MDSTRAAITIYKYVQFVVVVVINCTEQFEIVGGGVGG